MSTAPLRRPGVAGTVLLLLLAPACSKSSSNNTPSSARTKTFSSELATRWFDLLYQVVKTQGMNPPLAARAYGYAGITLYEAVVPGMPDHQSLEGQLHLLEGLPDPAKGKKYDWPSAANAALERLLLGLLTGLTQTNTDAITDLAQEFDDSFSTSVKTSVFDRSVQFGQDLADAILAWAATDGLAEFGALPYVPPSGAGLWVPTPPANAPALLPYWGLMRPFVLLPASECPPGAHPAYSTDMASAFYAEGNEVYTVTGDAGANLTADQSDIAFFWADGPTATGTPGGHWVALLSQILEENGLTLDVAAEGFALVGIAIRDAFIECWQVKYQYNLLRPITYIQTEIDGTWDPLLTTPNFPEYTSGHSTQSGAAAVVLDTLFGPMNFTDRVHVRHNPNIVALLNDPSGERSFSSFAEAADEAAISRLYGGIHYRAAIDNGVVSGICIGEKVLERARTRE